MTFPWSAEFQPRSLCNYGSDGPDGGEGSSPASSDASAYSSGFDSNSYYSGDASSYGTGYEGAETGGQNFSSDTAGTNFNADTAPTGGTNFSSDFGGGTNFSTDTGVIGNSATTGGWNDSVSGNFSAGPGMGYGPDTGSPMGWGPTGYDAWSGVSSPFASGLAPGDPGGLDMAQPGAGPQGPPGLDPSAPVYGQQGANPYVGPLGQLANPNAPAALSPDEQAAMQAHSPGYQPPGDPFGAPTNATGGPPFGSPGSGNNPLAPEQGQPQQGQQGQQGWIGDIFGPNQAQAGPTSSDQFVSQLQGAPTTSQMGLDATFANVGQMINSQMASNPGLAQALDTIAGNTLANSGNLFGANLAGVSPGQLGPGISPFAGPTPGAQQGFSGISAQQGTAAFDSMQGKGDSLSPSARGADEGRMTNADILASVNPLVTQQGYQQLATEMALQQQQQQIAAQELGEQGKAGKDADNFNARFGDPTQFAPSPDNFNARFGDWAQQPQVTSAIPAQTEATNFDYESGRGPETTRGADRGPETISLRPGEDVISSLLPASRAVGGEAAPLGLLSMMNPSMGRPGGSPAGNPFEAGRPGGNPFTAGGRPSSVDDTDRAPLSITVGGRPSGGPTGGGRPGGGGMYPGQQYGGMYGLYGPSGMPGTNTFGVSSREGAGGVYIGADGRAYSAYTGQPISSRR